MLGWIIALILGALVLPVVGLVYGAVRRPMDARDGTVVVALVGSISVFWLAAGVLTVCALF